MEEQLICALREETTAAFSALHTKNVYVRPAQKNSRVFAAMRTKRAD
jgi:hypothetical protein